MKYILNTLFVFLISVSVFAQNSADTEFLDYEDNSFSSLTGSLRNDAFVTKYGNYMYNDLLDAHLTFEKREDKWTAFADGRVYILYGDSADDNEEIEGKVMRLYGRYYTGFLSSEITFGKTFINVGINSVFNPFSLDKTVNFSDLSYDKEGLVSGEIKYFPSGLSEGNVFASYVPERANYIFGMSNSFNLLSFDVGFAAVRLMKDRKNSDLTALENNHNKTGFFFKGDVFFGIQSAYAYHFNDEVDECFNEFNFGIDYSFFSGKLFIETLFYYNEAGETDSEKYHPVPDLSFQAEYYNYSSVSAVLSELFSTGISSFINLIDYSSILIADITYQPADGFNLTLQGAYVTGEGTSEFNQSAMGEFTAVIRTEIIF